MRRRLHNPIVMTIAVAVVLGLPLATSCTSEHVTIGYVSDAIRTIAPWKVRARVNPDISKHAETIIVQRWFSTLDAFDTDDPPGWAQDLDWWGKDDGLDKWQAYDIPGIRRAVPGLIFEVATTNHHLRGLWDITNAPPPTDAELLAFASSRAGNVNPWNDSWSDRVAADGLIRIEQRTGVFLNPFGIAIDLLWLLSPLVAIDAWRHRNHWPSRLHDGSKCPNCGYDRSATPNTPCPECGHTSS